MGERPRLRDEFAHERREFLIEAVSWHEDSEGRIGYERARDMVDAHATEAVEHAIAAVEAICAAATAEDEIGEFWVSVSKIRAALDPAPTTDADGRDERRDGAGGAHIVGACWCGSHHGRDDFL